MNLRCGVLFVNDVPTFKDAIASEAKSSEYFCCVVLCLWLLDYRMDGSCFVNEECSPVRAVVFFSHEFFQPPDSECLVHGFVLVTRQIKGEVIFVDELAVFLGRVRAHAQYLDS